MKRIKAKGIVYGPVLGVDRFLFCCVIRDLEKLKAEAEVIIANRVTDKISDVGGKVFTRDVFDG